jgi:hypothetical protein
MPAGILSEIKGKLARDLLRVVDQFNEKKMPILKCDSKLNK